MILKTILGCIIGKNASRIVTSALVAGAVTFTGTLIANATDVINVTVADGGFVTLFVAGIKVLQKWIALLEEKKFNV